MDSRSERRPRDTEQDARLKEALLQGARVVLLEDIVTTGNSAFLAIEALEDASMDVVGVLCLVDREEGGRARLEGYGLTFISVFTKTHLLQHKFLADGPINEVD